MRGAGSPYAASHDETTHGRLLLALAEHLKSPLLHIARGAELTRLEEHDAALSRQMLTAIETAAETALQLVDNYITSAHLATHQLSLPLEPVTVSAVMYDAAQSLQRAARHQGCELEVSFGGKLGPVMANRQALEGALTSLGYVFIEACQKLEAPERVIRLAAHNTSRGVVAGVFSRADGLSAGVYRKARELYGRARLPMPELAATAGAGVFVADSLLASMDSTLRVARYQHAQGLAATLIPSKQLQLI